MLLLDRLKESKGRIINVTSSLHHFVSLNFDDIQGFKSSHWGRYSKSKLDQIYFTYELQRRLNQEKCGVTINACHPGYIASDIVKYIGDFLNNLFVLLWESFGWTVENGSRGIVHAASSPKMSGIGGKYLSKLWIQNSSKISYDEKVEKRLWDVSEKLTGLK